MAPLTAALRLEIATSTEEVSFTLDQSYADGML
jgi:hypothetical protein